jgi:hypothetical protein
LDVLSTSQRVALYAICEALFSGDAGPPPKARVEWLVDDAEDFLREAGSRATRSIKLLLVLVVWLAPWFALRPTALRAMPLELRVRVLDRMERSFAGALIVALKAALCIVYYEHPDAAAEIGFDGGCLVEPAEEGASPAR